jgi:prepilin-type N-terminal cleavage/methylation domain-containing protein
MVVAPPSTVFRPCHLTDLKQAGFALPEILMVLAIMAVIMGIGIGNFSNEMATVQGDADMNIVYWQLKLAREVAINQRRSVEVVFTPPNFISLVRHDFPNGTTVVGTAVLEHKMRFQLFQGMPDTPDAFGNATAINFGTAQQVMFTADGLFVDEAGNPVNGSIFIGQDNKPLSARAITVFAPTAGIRTYRWSGSAWRH